MGLLNEQLTKFNMKINVEKSKTMIIGVEKRHQNIHINGTRIVQVSKFKYLGTAANNRGTLEERNERVAATEKLYNSLKGGV